jgi:hypothetical protein
MKFQICTCKKHSFDHGNFFDENGPFFRGEGLTHLSGDVFCQAEALAFVQEALDSGKITLEEACSLGRDQVLLSLPDEVPSGLVLYQKNEKARTGRMVTKEGERRLALCPESKHSFMRFMKWLLPTSVFRTFSAKQASSLRQKNYKEWRRAQKTQNWRKKN